MVIENKPAVSDDDLVEMIKLQELLNIAYNGEKWRDAIKIGWVKAAVIDETSEFLREISKDWMWWKRDKGVRDTEKAIFEFIDVVHFMLVLALYRISPEGLSLVVYRTEADADRSFQYPDELNVLFIYQHRFMYGFDYDQQETTMRNFKSFLEMGCKVLEIESGDLMKAYRLKNELNFERVLSGPGYDRSSERELKL